MKLTTKDIIEISKEINNVKTDSLGFKMLKGCNVCMKIYEIILKEEQKTKKIIYCHCGSKDIKFLREDKDLNLKFYYCNNCKTMIQKSNYD